MINLFKQVKLKLIYALLVVTLPVLLALSTLAAAQETSGNFQGGSVRIGYDSRTCDGTLAGSIRYNSATNTIQVCDGASWQTWGG
ncbi:hypothetical protein [Pseudomonas asiatica]|uniref:hypothetical protein n=1 Tax=Pseudomonas asiatica TaxID=2219225 RepID=UPI0010C0E996|nr:hypothetical protein [Pseudomonas asiatica]